MKVMRVLIIDDERAAREELKRALLNYPLFQVVGEAQNADEARMEIQSRKPDLIFLDIQMPGESGFELLASLPEVPEVIFTTAFDQYAVQAFEVNALDYLMKPIRDERFAKALERVTEHRKKKEAENASLSSDRTIFIKDGERCHFVKLKEVYLIESMDNYARLYFGDQKAFLKTSLNQLNERLDETMFFRISRTHIINLNYIKEIFPMPKGKLRIGLSTGEILDVSDRQSVKFKLINGV
ncbi:LytR/AlgR family response regulator transcription factor [Pedobacter caeni]|uniref:Two component transcriptional regulator, LytTR family n=1 Tax=Pedobacter caeni TaxID=288992 RepID=A0A1M5LBZ8_9SPHI|nr:LytTR family DNA-binding domain-containing protein [Pedobacter caeni]SHG62624.1 two component transcriptional regulator, LytTR family [Pedobacter caeni]